MHVQPILLTRDIDPSAYGKINKATKAHIENTSFDGVGREWFIMWKDDITEGNAKRTLTRRMMYFLGWVTTINLTISLKH